MKRKQTFFAGAVVALGIGLTLVLLGHGRRSEGQVVNLQRQARIVLRSASLERSPPGGETNCV